MNANDVLATIRKVLGYIGTALAVVALLKLFGVRINVVPGGIEAIALVAIACRMA